MQKLFIYIILFFASIQVIGCSSSEGRMDMADANLLILVASSYREQKCGARPAHTFFVIQDPVDFAVNACMFTLMRDPCPFDAYPLVCLELYDIDIPFIGPNLSEYPEASDNNIFENLFSEIL